MKTNRTSSAAFFNSRLLFGFALCSVGLLIGLATLSKSVTGTIAATPDTNTHNKHHHYKLIDVGTFGGPSSFINTPQNIFPALNSSGSTVGASGTTIPTTPTSNPIICGGQEGLNPEVYHGFGWRNGAVADLGSLAGANYCSDAGSINARGEIGGSSENGLVDPVLGFNETHAVVWKNGEIIDLGTFGGSEGLGLCLNNRGQEVGLALNAVPDPFSVFDFALAGSSNGTQTRAFLWDEKNGLQDLGTLGGPDAWASVINERGQIAGQSYTNSIPNPSTGFPTMDPALWDNGKIRDLGTLGGVVGFSAALNNRGQVVGGSSIASDPGACYNTGSFEFFNPDCHPFLWDQGTLIDLTISTIGAVPLTVLAISDAGEIVGGATFPSGAFDAFVWRNRVATDLGNLGDAASVAFAINSHGQVVGSTFLFDGSHSRAFLWQNSSTVDLNTLIPAGSSLHLSWAMAINDRGEIAGEGVPRGCALQDLGTCGHAFVLIPCDENHPGIEDCDYSLVEAPVAVAQPVPATRDASSRTLPPSLMRRMSRYHFPGRAFGPKG
jgi:probable HAF family extracellular repeat protein